MSRLFIRILIEIATAVPVALLLKKYVLMFVCVRGSSMRDTLEDREFVFAHPCLKSTKIDRFDIVLCRYPHRRELFIKRVVALPGERMALEEGVLLIDGAPVAEDFPLRRSPRPVAERVLGPYEYFVLGDNRLSSHDSRSVGPIRREMIVARVRCVILPLKKRRLLK